MYVYSACLAVHYKYLLYAVEESKGNLPAGAAAEAEKRAQNGDVDQDGSEDEREDGEGAGEAGANGGPFLTRVSAVHCLTLAQLLRRRRGSPERRRRRVQPVQPVRRFSPRHREFLFRSYFRTASTPRAR